MNMPLRTMKPKPTSIKAASVIASAITKRLLSVVTEAPYVAVAGVSGSLYNARHDHCSSSVARQR
jgi:hypothetical protein